MNMEHNYDNIPIPVSVRRMDGRYTYVNRAWSEMFSVEVEHSIGHTDHDLGLEPLAFPEGEPGSNTGEFSFRDVYITTREKGRLLLELIETRVGSDDEVEGIMCVHQDMTGIGWRMEDLTRNLSRCEYRSRQNMQHLVRLSRDMCEPLDQMVLYCDKLAQGRLNGENQEWLSLVRDNARMLQKNMQRSIDLSVLDDGVEECGDEALSLGAMLGEVSELYANIAKDKGVSVETHVSAELEHPVMVDVSRVRQILVNLVDSAIRGAKPGQVRISASLIPGSERPLCLKVRVENPKEAAHSQGDGSNLPRMNMGLSHKIVRGLCGIIGGRFEICRDTDGARVLRVFLRATQPKPTKSRK